MKKLIVAILILISFSAKTQTSVYHLFPDSNATWNVRLQDANYEEDCSYVFSGDTLINGLNYHKIFKPFVNRIGNNNQLNYAGYCGALRQDTANRKVYIDSAGTDKTLYDFNLQVADTLKGYAEYFCPFFIKTVTSFDSILIGSSYRKMWNTNYGFSIIEGIGSTLGLLDFCPYPLSPYNMLICFQQNGQTLYPNSTTTCDVITDVKDVLPEIISIKIFPNPFQLSATLQLSSYSENTKLKIYNTFGEQVRDEKVISQFTPVNRGVLNDGIYFFQVTNGKEQLASGKFIIE